MNGGDEGGSRKTDRALIVSVAALLLGVATFAANLNDKSGEKAVELEKRLMRIECKLRIGECEGTGR